MDIDLRGFGMDPATIAAIATMFDVADEVDSDKPHPPSRAYVRDAKAMRNTPADIIEYPNSYQFIVDMPGLKREQIKVHVEDSNVLVVSGERRREKEEGVKYVRMERRVGKLLKKFILPENANMDAISAVNHDGVLKVMVEKLPPPEPKKPKTIEVKVGSPSEEAAPASDGKGPSGQLYK
ncbi:unnamed protein product [Lactuca saligna]|uniref:SHSP domain-containing protein n=1 Tax=Lactuca saligna TaxID=75948 RepID=A0AA35ZKL5_LACSI|nr:unnamed protein product [Lactuca saligna]